MPRKRTPISPDFPNHVSARSNNRDWFEIPMDTVWRIYEDYLGFAHHAHNMRIHAFVLMNNHFHMIARFPDNNIAQAMNYFMRETARCIGREAQRINHIYGRPYFRSSIASNHYFEHAYKYIYRNPLQAKITGRAEDYKYSTFGGLVSKRPLYIPLEEDTLLLNDPTDTLAWVNQPVEEADRLVIKKALKHQIFKLAKCTCNKKPHALETRRF